MLEKVHLVGCGTIGSHLATTLIKIPELKEIHLYDLDETSIGGENYIFPFTKFSEAVSKVQYLESILRLFNSSVSIITHETKIEFPVSNGFVIDCRDNKNTSIRSTIRISLDGHLLIIDSLERPLVQKYGSYFIGKDYCYIELASAIIITFLREEMYKESNLYVYHLDDIVKQPQIVEEGDVCAQKRL